MIKAEGLTKHYGALKAVDGISFKVEPGEVLGFLGPNGAGKSTTMRMFAGFVPPSAGHAEICGYSIATQAREAKSRLGYLPEGAPTYGEMAVGEFLDFIAAIRGLRGSAARNSVEEIIDRLNIREVVKQKIDTLSKGFKRRVGLAQAIIHDPPVLILDEPTDGLDPNQKHEVRQLIAEMSANKIIVISTHILEEVDAVCNRAIIIANGRILADETPEALINRSRYHNAVSMKLGRGADMAAITAALAKVNGVSQVEAADDGRVITAFPQNNAQILTAIGDLAGAQAWPLEQLQLESGRLDEVFRTITTTEASQ
ncbi:MAG: ABC transporter ATP-binding protein [Gammaproteobacteria bacterium]